jgi:solute carrier family 25 protein 16
VQKLKPTGILICGAISGAVAQTFSYPIEVVRRNMQVGRMRGITMEWSNLIDTAKTIYRGRGGVKGFFAGLGIGYMKVAPMHAVSFYSYEILKQLFTID